MKMHDDDDDDDDDDDGNQFGSVCLSSGLQFQALVSNTFDAICSVMCFACFGVKMSRKSSSFPKRWSNGAVLCT